MPARRLPIVFVLIAAGTPFALAEGSFLINDRTNDTVFRIADLDNNDAFDEPAEVNAFFSGANAAGTLGIANPTSLATAPNGACAMGDQSNRLMYVFRDNNGDGDAEDAAESVVFADASNMSGVSFAFPTGAAFGPDGHLYVVNAGNTFGDDGVYRLVDMNNDGDAQDAGEITPFAAAGAFGPGNGSYSPQEIVWVGDTLFLRNSSAGLHGVFRLHDMNGDDDADDAGEFTAYFDASNASGVALSAGFGLTEDAARPGALYTAQIASGGVDQVIRFTDLNGDDDANDAGEAVLVYENTSSGFSLIDLVALPDGRLIITDASGDAVLVLTDLDGDDDFLDPAEQSTFFANSAGLLGDVRQIDPLASTSLGGDANADGVVDFADLNAVLSAFGSLGLGLPGNVNGDGGVDFADLNAVLSNFGSTLP